MKKKLIEVEYYELLEIHMPTDTAYEWYDRIESGDMTKFNKWTCEVSPFEDGIFIFMYDENEILKQELIYLAENKIKSKKKKFN